jgi:CubicO group peptidase (beta-lactamase class C family)
MRSLLIGALAGAVVAGQFLHPCLVSPARAQAAPAPEMPAANAFSLSGVVAEAQKLERLHGLIVAHDGEMLIEARLRGPALDGPVNIKSASKTIIAALVGRAIEEGLLDGIDQPVAPILSDRLPETPDPRLSRVTIGHLLSMQSGLERTSGGNYGRWVSSRNWVRFVLSRPFVDEPGGGMLYSTGNTHLLSAILTKVSGRSTRELFADWLGEPLGIRVGGWERDPQGIYLGGNNMALSPRALFRFGEMMRNGGKVGEAQVLPESWIAEAWRPRTRSVHSGDSYGFGWFMREMGGRQVYYAWGFGGQMLYVVPDLALTVVITSDVSTPAGRTGYVRDLHRLVAETIIPAVEGTGAALHIPIPKRPS